ncbi:hypothetical protein OIU83_14750 [Flavobacterium sp. LS1R49]|uniref:Tissue inhibitor of metalloproteinase n=1 Tax=Flavobacterium shii TaxID=2987687 RepID=A0A9X2ZJU0_9FLAO|nr:hypothetical protein [Flavobacterium shii]MCV9928928.1 hypothetical protein [Flavobacterium shii]
MKLKHLLLLAFFCFYNYSYSCKCEPHNREIMVAEGLKNYDIVFYGELVKSDTISGNFTFKILELFKGEINSAFISGSATASNCSVLPIKKELWIVYANYTNNTNITISMCSPSMGLESLLGAYPTPPPSRYYEIKDIDLRDLYQKVYLLEDKNQNIVDWIQQLERLRTYKSSQNIISEKEKTELKIESYSRYIIISLIVNIVLFSFLIIIILKKNLFTK